MWLGRHHAATDNILSNVFEVEVSPLSTLLSSFFEKCVLLCICSMENAVGWRSTHWGPSSRIDRIVLIRIAAIKHTALENQCSKNLKYSFK
jgi:hypothetical protein